VTPFTATPFTQTLRRRGHGRRCSAAASAVLLLGLLAACGGAAGADPRAAQQACDVQTADPQPAPTVPRPETWGGRWLPALAAARADQALARIAVVGDSIGEGLYASDLERTSWAARVTGELQASGGDGGSGFEGMQRSRTFLEGFPAGASRHYLTTPGNAWDQTGGWRTPQWPHGPAYGALVATEPGSTVSIPFTGTGLVVWYADRGDPWTYSVDGGPERRVVPAGTGAPIHLDLDGLAAGTHTVRITAESTDGPWLSGVEGTSERGVRVDNYSIAGLESGAWNNSDEWRSGELVGGAGAPADLVIYELGGNDALKAVRPVGAMPIAGSVEVPGAGWQAIDVGRLVTGPGIPPGTTVAAVDPEASTATLSQAPTSSARAPVELVVTNTDVAEVWWRNVQGYLAGLERRPGGMPAPDLVFVWAPASATPEIEERYEQLKTESRVLADSLGAVFVDVQAATGQPWSSWCGSGRAGNENDPTASGADGGHPSDAGHRYLADLVLSVID
jgi:lysophospholipase L1-like esterase